MDRFHCVVVLLCIMTANNKIYIIQLWAGKSILSGNNWFRRHISKKLIYIHKSRWKLCICFTTVIRKHTLNSCRIWWSFGEVHQLSQLIWVPALFWQKVSCPSHLNYMWVGYYEPEYFHFPSLFLEWNCYKPNQSNYFKILYNSPYNHLKVLSFQTLIY